MKAKIIKGKHKGKIVKIDQYANDWFTINTGDPMIDRLPLSPTFLAFTHQGIAEIQQDKHTGILFNWFDVKPTFGHEPFLYTFKRRKLF